jgi:hypothetical protein
MTYTCSGSISLLRGLYHRYGITPFPKETSFFKKARQKTSPKPAVSKDKNESFSSTALFFNKKADIMILFQLKKYTK